MSSRLYRLTPLLLVPLAFGILSLSIVGGCPAPQTPAQPDDMVDDNDQDTDDGSGIGTGDDSQDRPVIIPDPDTGDGTGVDDGGGDDGGDDGSGDDGNGGDTGQTPPSVVSFLRVYEPIEAAVLRPPAEVDMTYYVNFDSSLTVQSAHQVIARDSDLDGLPDGNPQNVKAIAITRGNSETTFETADALPLLTNQLGSFLPGIRVVLSDGTSLTSYAPGTVTVDGQAPTATWLSVGEAGTTLGQEDHLINRNIAWSVRLQTNDNSAHEVEVLLDPDLNPDNANEVTFRKVTFGPGNAARTLTTELSSFPIGKFYYYFVVTDGFEPVGAYAQNPNTNSPMILELTDRLVGEFDLNGLVDSDPNDASPGFVLQGFNFNDLAGSSISRVPSLNDDNFDGVIDDNDLDELIVGSRFGKAYIIANEGVGFGEAYMIYGRSTRLRGTYPLNSVGQASVPGLIFPGIRTPRTANIAAANESTRWTQGLSDITVVPDMDGDELPEIVFSFPRAESVSLTNTTPTIQHPELFPDLDPSMGNMEYDAEYLDEHFHTDTWEWDGAEWLQVTPGPDSRPGDRLTPGLAFDSARGVTVFHGGDDGSFYYNDTWEFDGTTWVQVQTPTPGPFRMYHAMGYFPGLGTILFGGRDGVPLNDTWLYDGVDWTQLTTATSPPAVDGAAMAYDSVRKVLVLAGGIDLDTGTPNTQIWEFDGSDWKAAPITGFPDPRVFHGMSYDEVNQKTVLFGGFVLDPGPPSALLPANDTWTWDGFIWQQVPTTTAPSPRDATAMTFDAARGYTILFGGNDQSDTWAFDGADWTKLTEFAPPGRAYAAMTYDSNRQVPVVTHGSLFDYVWNPNESQFSRGGVVIVSSHNELLQYPFLLNRKSDRVIDLHEVGQLFNDMLVPRLIPYIEEVEYRDPAVVCADCDNEPADGAELGVFEAPEDPNFPGDPTDPNQWTLGDCGDDGCEDLLSPEWYGPSSKQDGKEQPITRAIVRWDVTLNDEGPGGFHASFTLPPADPPLSNLFTFPFQTPIGAPAFPFDAYPNIWLPQACDDMCEVTNEWVVWGPSFPGTSLIGTPTWATLGTAQQSLPNCYPWNVLPWDPNDPTGCVLPVDPNNPAPGFTVAPCPNPALTVNAFGARAWTGFYGPIVQPLRRTDSNQLVLTPIGARIMGQKIDDEFGTAVASDGTWLYISAPQRTVNEDYRVGNTGYVPDVSSLLSTRQDSGVVYQLRTYAPDPTTGVNRTQLWLERRIEPVGPGAFNTFAMVWPTPDAEMDGVDGRRTRTDYTMPTPHQYIIESVGSTRGDPNLGWFRSTVYDSPTECPPSYTPEIVGQLEADAVDFFQTYPPGTAGYYVDRTPQIVGPHADAEISFVRALGDVNSDGVSDFAVGSPNIKQTVVNGTERHLLRSGGRLGVHRLRPQFRRGR
jgi:hypothetical protein